MGRGPRDARSRREGGDQGMKEKLVRGAPRQQGHVTSVELGRGFGFIEGDDGRSRFFHFTAVAGGRKGFDALAPGDQVTFLPEASPKGLRAVGIEKC